MTITQPILITKGNAPLVKDNLVDQDGNPVDLTGATVQFAFQGASYQFVHNAVVVTPLTGAVSYQFVIGETDVLGDYQAQWQVTKSGIVTLYPVPAGTIPFTIVQGLPQPAQASPNNIVLVAQMHELVRVTLGDFNPQFRKYQDDAIDAVIRTCLITGLVPGQSLAPDRITITPGILLPTDAALLMYHAAKKFIMPDIADYRYETRALSERFGRQDSFYFELTNAIYELENGAMFSCFQSFYSWVNALSGIDIWSVLSDMSTQAPVATVNIGRAGVTVTTS
jgi:hypothetical protein